MTKDEFQKAVDDVIADCIRNDYSFGSYAYKVTEAVWPLLEAAEKERDATELMSLALRAKIAEMGQQEPVAWAATDETRTVVEALGMNKSRRFDSPLFLAAGAQPAPSVPDGFAWPECPKRRQSHVLFDDGYEEGWAACVATIKAALAAPEAKP